MGKYGKRYDILLDIVEEEKPKSIIEIGTYKGYRAIDMSITALKYNSVHYYGYDLFEDITSEMRIKEMSYNDCAIEFDVKKLLGQLKFDCLLNNKNKFDYTLIRGNTKETLVDCDPVDFVWLDGGHSIETIESDYENVKRSKCIVFDDYISFDDPTVGCNVLVDKLDAKVILTDDPQYINNKIVGTIGIAIVRR